MEEFFSGHSEESRKMLAPFNIYIMKLLNCKKDILRKDLPELLKRHPWVTDYMQDLASSSAVDGLRFSYINDPVFNENRTLMSKHLGKMEEFLKVSEKGSSEETRWSG